MHTNHGDKMKVLPMIMLALFSFVHEEKYPVQSTCENNVIQVQYENEWYEVELFNVFLKKDSNICPYIKEKAKISFDSYTKIESPLRVYFFVDDILLQQTLIDDNQATIKINNPNYKYVLKEKKEEAVVAEVKEEKEKHISYSRYIAYAFLILYGIVCIILLKRRKKKSHDEEELQD